MVRTTEMRGRFALPKAFPAVVSDKSWLGHSLDSLNAEWICKPEGSDAPGFQKMKEYGID